MKEIKIWEPIAFNDEWTATDTSLFDELAASWFQKRKELEKGNKEYQDFLNRLKRQHAIETGILEKLYDLSEGITQTFIKEGFIESFLSHNDTNIPPAQLMGYLKSHFEAMDFIFDMVKNNRQITKSFILELHQLILQHQTHTFAVNTLGKTVKVKVLKGKFKEHPNNPKREDGTIFQYCPPVHVDAKIEKLISIYQNLEKKKIHPIIIASWFHHAFTQIHPFQDGNGRIARLLTSLILIKHNLFPLNILREEKPEYIKALEEADKGQFNPLVTFFSKIQRRNIEAALNIPTKAESLEEAAEILKEKIENLTDQQKEKRKSLLNQHRDLVLQKTTQIVKNIQKGLLKTLPKEKVHIEMSSQYPNEKNAHIYTPEIIEYANKHSYFFNKNLPSSWFKLSITTGSKEKRYDIVISIHHYGYSDSVIAIGAFLKFSDQTPGKEVVQDIPIDLNPYTISLEKQLHSQTEKNLEAYLQDVVKIGLSVIANEL